MRSIPNCNYNSLYSFNFFKIQLQNWDPNAEESGKIWNIRSFNYNMYWLLLKCIQKTLDLGQEVFIIRVTLSTKMKGLKPIYP